MAEERLKAIDPRRRVDRSKYVDPEMPEFPGAVFLNHVGIKGAQVGATLGCLVFAPIAYMRGKGALFSTLMPRMGANFMIGGYVAGTCAATGMVVANKGGKTPLDIDGIDDRAYRIVKNESITKMNMYTGAGATAAFFASPAGFLGPIAVGTSFGGLAMLFAEEAMPKLRKEVWPQIKPQLVDGLRSAGINPDELTTGGTPEPVKKKGSKK